MEVRGVQRHSDSHRITAPRRLRITIRRTMTGYIVMSDIQFRHVREKPQQ